MNIVVTTLCWVQVQQDNGTILSQINKLHKLRSPNAPDLTKQKVLDIVANASVFVYKYVKDDLKKVEEEIVGMATLNTSYTFGGKIGYVSNISVLGKYQNKEVADRLMEQIIRWAKEHGLKALELICDQKPEDTRGLYIRQGFRRRDVWTMWYTF